MNLQSLRPGNTRALPASRHTTKPACLHLPHVLLQQPRTQHRPFLRHSVIVRAAGENDDDDFESKLTRLTKKKPAKKEKTGDSKKASEPKYDFSDEELHFESGPHGGDLATNVALGATLVWLPLTFASLGRAIFVKYRFTDKRLSVITNAPWKSEQLDAAYQEVKDVQTVGRGVGIWGDMVVTLRNNDKIELRSLPRFLEMKSYILDRKDALSKSSPGGRASGMGAANADKSASAKGF